jgi:hypothetical protein
MCPEGPLGMQKRVQSQKQAPVEAEESAFKVGAVVLFYDDGWRAAHVVELGVDDAGELLLVVQPVGCAGSRMKKKTFKALSNDIKII